MLACALGTSGCQVVAGLTDLQFEDSVSCVPGGPGPIAYVSETASGAGTGVSWSNAFSGLDEALTYAAGCAEVREIWVAAGRYTPGQDSSASFRLVDGVSIYGGFAGSENMLADRDWMQNVTILSGDIGNDDVLAQGVVLSPDDIRGDNSRHVISATDISSGATVDGFTITGGQAAGADADADGNGGGLHLSNASVTLQNMALIGNEAAGAGGALWADSSTLALDNVSAQQNRATDGGALWLRQSALSATLLALQESSAGGHGGALYADGGTLDVRDALLWDSRAGLDGGAAYHRNVTANYLRVQLRGNAANGAGGAVAQIDGSLRYEDVLLSGNAADGQGGAAFTSGSKLFWANVTANGNRAGNLGGALYHEAISDPVILANTIVWGNADMTGAGGPSASISNQGAAVEVSTSIIQASYAEGVWLDAVGTDLGGNLDVDPLLEQPLTPDLAPTTEGDLRLRYASPAIDAGSPTHVIEPTDLTGSPRPGYLGFDIGAYELYAPCEEAPVAYVNLNAAGTQYGDSWTDAFPSLQRALFHAERCATITEIWVARGIYKPGEAQQDSYIMQPGLAIYGGFAGTETALDERDPALNLTVLSGDIDNNDIVDQSGITVDADDANGGNTRHLITATDATIGSNSILDGFVLTGGDAQGAGEDDHGGAILIREANPTFGNLVITGNRGTAGGAIRCEDGSLTMRDSVVRNNEAGTGAGIRAQFCQNMTFSNVDFINNRAQGASNGGGAFLIGAINLTVTGGVWEANSASYVGGAVRVRDNSTTSWRNVIFRGNEGLGGNAGGGAVSLFLGSHQFENVLFSGNRQQSNTGGALDWVAGSGTLQLINCTLAGNRADGGGGLALDLTPNSQATVDNTIFWNNADALAGDTLSDSMLITNGPVAQLTVRHSLIQYAGASGMGWDPNAGIDGGNNVSFDPQFLALGDPANAPTSDGDYHLSVMPQSPAIGVGDNALISPDNTLDLDGNPRILGTIDLGPYESQ